MRNKNKKISSIGEIRIHLTNAIKGWQETTSDLSWPEHDHSMAAMDNHISTLRAVNAKLAAIETNMPPVKQKSLAIHFDEAGVQDPGKFAPFAEAVKLAIAA